MKKRMNRDRKQQVATTKLRHGNDHYEIIGAKSASFKDKSLASRAANIRWHPERYDEDGTLKEDYSEDNS